MSFGLLQVCFLAGFSFKAVAWKILALLIHRLGSPFANLGTAWGGERLDVEVPLSHPLGSAPGSDGKALGDSVRGDALRLVCLVNNRYPKWNLVNGIMD